MGKTMVSPNGIRTWYLYVPIVNTIVVDFSRLKLTVFCVFQFFSWISKHPCYAICTCHIGLWGTHQLFLSKSSAVRGLACGHKQRPYQIDHIPRAARLESLGAGCPIFRSDRAMDETKHLRCRSQMIGDAPRCWVNIPEVV